MKQSGWVYLWVSLVVFVLDQLTKSMASARLDLYVPNKVTEFFNLTLMHNEGVAFSILADQSGWQRYFIAVVASLIVIWLLYWLRQNARSMKLQNTALVLVVGGALGNIYDRIVLGYVVDFIELHYKSYYWPAFNLADSAITLGAILLIIDTFKNKESKDNTAVGGKS
ncbi:signal peptidase II [Marinicella sp. S1101]|uniref:signal peptidase II n=1 Tax=Marinicella marina TaxID=2996016 RepID=UPI002260E209|nr:signal peptidase II [Marinicella marina]MCX7554640.1 signal peptidase II [Marinicella marina]MDJ1140705.1 signal peptidase II [Marinicella marina]